MENTAAASVEDMIEPKSRPSSQDKPRAKWAKVPTRNEVRMTPTEDRVMASPIEDRAVCQEVSKPPEKMITIKATWAMVPAS